MLSTWKLSSQLEELDPSTGFDLLGRANLKKPPCRLATESTLHLRRDGSSRVALVASSQTTGVKIDVQDYVGMPSTLSWRPARRCSQRRPCQMSHIQIPAA